MKKLLLVLLAIGSFSAAGFASAPVVTVVSPSEVRIDGEHAGQLLDVMVNHPHLASAVQNAAAARFAGFSAQKDAERAHAVAAVTAQKDAELAAKDAQIAALRALLDRAGFAVDELLQRGPDSLKDYLAARYPAQP
jgi:hypothetical protein